MNEKDDKLARRVANVVAVVVEDLDAVSVEVEDGVAYLEGVVPDEGQRRALSRAVCEIDGVEKVISCLAIEHVLPLPSAGPKSVYVSAPVLMHYRSLS